MLSPLLLRTPPRVGSRRPGDLLDQLRMAWGLRGLDVRGTAEATRLFTMSIGDVLDEWFESPEVKGVLAINGVIGTWAGPEEPGTAYVMMHHTIGDVGDGHLGSWGYPIGGMGAVADAIRRAAESFGADVRTSSPVERIDVADGRVHGVTTADGRVLRAPVVVAATHPQITFLRQIDAAELPDDFVADLRRWRSRSGTVKVNVALSELPDFLAWPGTEPHERFTGSVELCHSIDHLQRAFQDARDGQAARRPFSDGVIPSTLDPTLAPEGMHVMSLFTQWVPASWSDEPHRDSSSSTPTGSSTATTSWRRTSSRPSSTVRSSGRGTWSTSTASSVATSSTVSSPPTSSSTCARRPATPTSRRPSTGSTSARRRPTAVVA